ncbi:restriction endonuclease subunit S [Empedobacter sp.]|uniref:restriction endonuclease subunit S n=1 Tax=Empedobacter sp. TaxID=1927715 RepID=UPI0028ACF67D|nr:restriction endonuclease subunit S [Empedobacter sp.]
MSKLEALLQGVKVKFIPLGEICETVTDYVAAGSFAALKENVKYNDEKDYAQLVRTKDLKSNFSKNDFVYVSEHAFNFLWRVNLKEECIILPNIGNCGEVYYLAPNVLPYENNVLGPNAILLRSIKYNNVYLSYIFKSDFFQNQLIKITTPGGQSKFNKTELKKLQIPIPCPDNPEKSLEIQQEIVRILDQLTETTNNLKNELENERQIRKKQFEFYREQLFRFEEGENNYVALGELAENLDSKRKPITSSQRKPGKIPYYGASGIVDYVEDYIFDGDYLLVSEDGANLLARSTPIAFSISGKNWVNNHAHILKFETKYERLFVEYYLNSIDLAPYITGAAQPKLNKKNLNSIKIPNPALEEQERIVKLLDQFDATHTAIEEEISKEIKLRTQQYEYYREKLLSFPQN